MWSERSCNVTHILCIVTNLKIHHKAYQIVVYFLFIYMYEKRKNTERVVHGRLLLLISSFYIPILLFFRPSVAMGLTTDCKSIALFPFMIAKEKPPFRYFRSLKHRTPFSFFPLLSKRLRLFACEISDNYRKFRITLVCNSAFSLLNNESYISKAI